VAAVDPSAPHYPVNLVLAGQPCLVVGGGPVAARKAAELVACGADVTVVAPEIGADMAELDVAIERRRYRPDDVDGCFLVVSAVDDPSVGQAVFDDAEAAGVLVNVADEPERCRFTLPARIRQGDLLVTFSTRGRSPALSSWLRRRFDAEFGPEYATLLDIVSEVREEIRESGRSTEGLSWQSVLDSGMLDLVRGGRITEAKERLRTCLSSSSA
jgi:precorrin-2 dehydrogenase/sirohydrochlorin ferrochelatase